MKCSKRFNLAHLSVCVVAISSILLTSISCSQQPFDSDSTDAYDFPVRGGTAAWRAFTSHAAMLEACQVPESVLEEMSTAGLVETVLDYPLYGDMRAYNSPQQGFDAVAGRFNGLEELLKREDAGAELLATYSTLDPAAIDEDWTSSQKGRYVWSIGDVEILLAQDAILSSLTGTQRSDLIKEAAAKYRAMQQSGIYGQSSMERTVWVIGRALQQESYSPFEQRVSEDRMLQDFLSSGSFADDLILNEILSQAQRFLSG